MVYRLFISAYLLLNLFGCAIVAEGLKDIAGISTTALEDGRKDAIKKTFNCDYKTCDKKAKEILGHIGAYIYTKDVKKKMIAVYVSKEDTTPVGLFFQEIDATHTRIEAASPSTYAKEYIAEKLFPALEKALNPEEKKQQE